MLLGALEPFVAVTIGFSRSQRWPRAMQLGIPHTAIWSNLPMTDVTVYGFPISTFVNIVRLILTHKKVPFDFQDLEPEMGGPSHLSLHPFNRVPILDHSGFRLYETSAIALYTDEAFAGPALQPKDLHQRARMDQWISAVGNYYYPYMSYHLSHERLIYPALGIAPDEKVVATPCRESRWPWT